MLSDRENAVPPLAVARGRWLELQDSLLRGLTHALSNRIATVSAAAYLLEHGDMTGQQGAMQLRSETERMDGLLQLLRLLPSQDGSSLEPVVPIDVIEQSIALHEHHSELRDVVVRVDAPSDVLPALVEPHAFMQALLLAFTSAKRVAFTHAGDVVVHVSSDPETVTIVVHSGHVVGDVEAAHTLRDAEAASVYLRSAQGTATPRDDGGCVITVPTLSAARRAGR